MNSMKCCSQRTRGALLVIEETSAVQALPCGPAWAPILPSLCLGGQLHRAWNARYFLAYLLTLNASAAAAVVVCTVSSLVGGVVRLVPGDLMLMMLDSSKFSTPSLPAPFLTFPGIASILGLWLYQLPPGGFLCFALYLAVTGQTTNEWYRGDRAWSQHCSPVARPPSAEPRSSRTFAPMGFGAALERSFYLCCTLGEKEEMRMGRVLLPLKYSIHLFRHMGTYFLRKKKKNLVLSVLIRHCARP